MNTIQFPGQQNPPVGMPESAWTNSGAPNLGAHAGSPGFPSTPLHGGSGALGELFQYKDIHAIHNSSGLQPGEVQSIPTALCAPSHHAPHRAVEIGALGWQHLPNATILELRRAYYASVSHMDEQVRAMRLRQTSRATIARLRHAHAARGRLAALWTPSCNLAWPTTPSSPSSATTAGSWAMPGKPPSTSPPIAGFPSPLHPMPWMWAACGASTPTLNQRLGLP